jgi:DNA-binding CsgD family transcriptional regulator
MSLNVLPSTLFHSPFHKRSFEAMNQKTAEMLIESMALMEAMPKRNPLEGLKLKPKQIQAVHLLSQGKTQKEVAALLSVSERTIYTWKQKAVFQQGLEIIWKIYSKASEEEYRKIYRERAQRR